MSNHNIGKLQEKRSDYTMDEDLKELILKAQSGDKDALNLIIKKLEPMINKYSYRLNYEDAKSELTAWIIELILSAKPNVIWAA